MDNLIRFGYYKTLPQSPGVYEIINTKTSDKYVGSSKNIRKRIIAHVGQLRNNKHGNTLLQRSFLKHGEDSFKVRFEITETEKTARELEQRHIDTGEYRYNLSRLATGGNIPTDALCQYDLDGRFITEYKSVKESSEFLKLEETDIVNCCVGILDKVGNYVFRFTNQITSNIDASVKYYPSSIDWVKFWYSKSYTIYEWDYLGNLINTHRNLENLCNSIKVTKRMFQKHLSQVYLTVKGKIYSLCNVFPGTPMNIRNKTLLRLNESGEVLERYQYPYIDTLNTQGYPYSVVIDCVKLRKGTNKGKGMFWKYDDGTDFKPIKTEGHKKKVKIVDIEINKTIGIFNTVLEASRYINTARTSVSKCLSKGRILKRKYKLEYVND